MQKKKMASNTIKAILQGVCSLEHFVRILVSRAIDHVANHFGAVSLGQMELKSDQ